MKTQENWMGIEGVEYHYYNEWSDPTVTYKGFTFSEWELTDAIQNWIDLDIAEGDIPKGTTIHEYLENENHHIIVTDILDDFVANQWEVLRENANMKLENTAIDLLDFQKISFAYYREEVSEDTPATVTTFTFMSELPITTQEEFHSEAFEQWDLQDSNAEEYYEKCKLPMKQSFQKIHDCLDYAMKDFNRTEVLFEKEDGTKTSLKELLHSEKQKQNKIQKDDR